MKTSIGIMLKNIYVIATGGYTWVSTDAQQKFDG